MAECSAVNRVLWVRVPPPELSRGPPAGRPSSFRAGKGRSRKPCGVLACQESYARNIRACQRFSRSGTRLREGVRAAAPGGDAAEPHSNRRSNPRQAFAAAARPPADRRALAYPHGGTAWPTQARAALMRAAPPTDRGRRVASRPSGTAAGSRPRSCTACSRASRCCSPASSASSPTRRSTRRSADADGGNAAAAAGRQLPRLRGQRLAQPRAHRVGRPAARGVQPPRSRRRPSRWCSASSTAPSRSSASSTATTCSGSSRSTPPTTSCTSRSALVGILAALASPGDRDDLRTSTATPRDERPRAAPPTRDRFDRERVGTTTDPMTGRPFGDRVDPIDERGEAMAGTSTPPARALDGADRARPRRRPRRSPGRRRSRRRTRRPGEGAGSARRSTSARRRPASRSPQQADTSAR